MQSVTFISKDTTTKGFWEGVYGSSAIGIPPNFGPGPWAGIGYNPLGYVNTFDPSTPIDEYFNGFISDVRALRKQGDTSQGYDSAFYPTDTPQMKMYFGMPDSNTHSFTMYFVKLAPYSLPNPLKLTFTDSGTNATLCEVTLTDAEVDGGVYVNFNVKQAFNLSITQDVPSGGDPADYGWPFLNGIFFNGIVSTTVNISLIEDEEDDMIVYKGIASQQVPVRIFDQTTGQPPASITLSDYTVSILKPGTTSFGTPVNADPSHSLGKGVVLCELETDDVENTGPALLQVAHNSNGDLYGFTKLTIAPMHGEAASVPHNPTA